MTWEIDMSTGTPILVFEKCSVIQDEQARLVLDALKEAPALHARVMALEAECKGKGRLISAQQGLRESLQTRVTELEAALAVATEDHSPACLCQVCEALRPF